MKYLDVVLFRSREADRLAHSDERGGPDLLSVDRSKRKPTPGNLISAA